MSKTYGVKLIIADALPKISKPYPVDVTFQVALVIEQDVSLLQRLEFENAKLGTNTTKQAIGRYTKQLTGLKSGHQVNAVRNTIIGSYTELYY